MKKFISVLSIAAFCHMAAFCEEENTKTGSAATASSSFTTIAWTTASIALLITTGVIVAIKIHKK